MGPTAKEKGVHLNHHCNDKTIVETDVQIIKTVVCNFISNAIKFSSAGDEIHVSCSNNNSYWEISVQDEGKGMSEESQQKLFGSDHSSTYGTKDEKGSGIGLKLCQDLVHLQDGEIVVDSAINEGATFTMRVPLNDED